MFGPQLSKHLFELNVSEKFRLLEEKPYSEKLWYTHNVHESPTIWWWWSRGRRWWGWWRDGGWSYCCCSLSNAGDEFIWQFSLVCLVLHLFLKNNHKLNQSAINIEPYVPAIIIVLWMAFTKLNIVFYSADRIISWKHKKYLKKSRLTTTFSKVVCNSVARSLYSSDRMSSWISQMSES